MRMEFRILNRMLDGPRFLRRHPRRPDRQGLDAALGAGDRLEGVDPAAVEAYFAPLADGDLEL